MDEKIINCNADQLRDIADAMDNPALMRGLDLERFIEEKLNGVSLKP